MSANPRVIGIAGGDLSGSFVDPVVISVAHVTGGTLAIGNGGTGTQNLPSDGQFLIGSGSSYALGTINAGSNISVTTGSGTLSVAVSSNPTFSTVTASTGFSGNLTGTASNADKFDNLNSTEFAILTASNIFTNSQTINGNLNVSGGVSSGNYIQLLPVGNVNIPTNLTASYIYTSGSTNDLYFTQYQGPFTNTTRLRWLEGTLYTGLLHGGILSTVTGTTSFNVTSGSGLIVTQNATTSSDPYPTIKFVQWGTYVSQSLQFSSSAPITYVSIDSNGEISQATSAPTFAQYKDRIFLGRILHQSGSVTNGSINTPPTAYGNTSNLADFARAIGPLKISGHFLAASGSVSLALTKTAGDSYVEGRNYAFNPNLPNIVVAADDPDVTVSKIYRTHTSGSSVIIDNGVAGAGYTTLDPTQYQNGNALAGVANNKFSVQRIYWFPRAVNRALFAYYGQAIYDNFDDAIAGISTENFTEGSNTAGSAILVAYVVLKGDSTNFTDTTKTRISQAGLFRGAGVGGGGTSGGGGATNLNGLSDVLIGTPVTGEALVYNGTEWVDGTPLNATSASFATNATSASFATTSSLATTASFATTSSFATSASYATTASFATTAQTASYLNDLTQNIAITGNLTVTGYYEGNGNHLTNLTASRIDNFTSDVRSKFTAGTDISIVSGVISYTGTGGSSGVSAITSSDTNLIFSATTGSITGSLSVNPSFTTVTASSGFSGNLTGTATNAVSAQTASYVATGSAIATFQTDVRNQLSAGSNLSYSSGQFSLSDNPSVTSVTASGGFSGNLTGTASLATNATSATTAQTASYVATGSAIATFQTDVRNQLSAGSNLSYSSGQFALSANPSVTTISASGAYITGDIRINGTASIGMLETISQSALVVGDKYIVIMSGATDHTSLDGSGVQWGSGSSGPTIDDLGSDAHIRYNSSIDGLVVYPRLSGSLTGAFSGNVTGTSSYATSAGTASYIATGSAIATFTTDVRAQFTAGTNISIVNGQISSTATAAGVTEDFIVSATTNLDVGDVVGLGTGTNAPLILSSNNSDLNSNAIGIISAISGTTVTVRYGGQQVTTTDLTGITVGTPMYVGTSGSLIQYSSITTGQYATKVGYVSSAGAAGVGKLFIQIVPFGQIN